MLCFVFWSWGRWTEYLVPELKVAIRVAFLWPWWSFVRVAFHRSCLSTAVTLQVYCLLVWDSGQRSGVIWWPPWWSARTLSTLCLLLLSILENQSVGVSPIVVSVSQCLSHYSLAVKDVQTATDSCGIEINSEIDTLFVNNSKDWHACYECGCCCCCLAFIQFSFVSRGLFVSCSLSFYTNCQDWMGWPSIIL